MSPYSPSKWLQVTARLDIHWTPQYWSALPCSSNYSLVGSLEHMESDLQTTMSLLHMHTEYQHKNKGRRHGNETLAYWFDQIPDNQMETLKAIYRLDFDIF